MLLFGAPSNLTCLFSRQPSLFVLIHNAPVANMPDACNGSLSVEVMNDFQSRSLQVSFLGLFNVRDRMQVGKQRCFALSVILLISTAPVKHEFEIRLV